MSQYTERSNVLHQVDPTIVRNSNTVTFPETNRQLPPLQLPYVNPISLLQEKSRDPVIDEIIMDKEKIKNSYRSARGGKAFSTEEIKNIARKLGIQPKGNKGPLIDAILRVIENYETNTVTVTRERLIDNAYVSSTFNEDDENEYNEDEDYDGEDYWNS